MAVIATSFPREDFIVQINGDYNIPFDELTVVNSVSTGQIVANGDGKYAIASREAPAGSLVRMMVRGNPSTVNAAGLVGYVEATHKDAFEAQGIIVVNQ